MTTTTKITGMIVGAKHHPGALTMLGKMSDDASVTLVREPDNPHDPNAVAVFYAQVKLGFIRREKAAEIAAEMDGAGRKWITGRFNKLDGVECSVTVELYGPGSAGSGSAQTGSTPARSTNAVDMAAAAKAAPVKQTLACPICGGTGKFEVHQCWGCKGKGQI